MEIRRIALNTKHQLRRIDHREDGAEDRHGHGAGNQQFDDREPRVFTAHTASS
jgi:predicted glutamine amidotransferase